jgi:predicted O-methyltransferase YrrM
VAEIIPYTPTKIVRPDRYLEGYGSAWYGNESILQELLDRFNIGRKRAIEFGTEHGHSAIALSNFFEQVICVDPWLQEHADQTTRSMYDVAQENVKPYSNITLVRSRWQEFCGQQGFQNGIPTWLKPDLIHIDADHSYDECYKNGEWACENCSFVIFHDTAGFPEVRWAVSDLADKYHRKFYAYEVSWGLGILTALEMKP